MADAPLGVPSDGVSRDGAVPSSRVVVEDFFGSGKLLPPTYGPASKGTRVRVWFSGSGQFAITLGDVVHETALWTTAEGVRALIGELGAVLSRAEIAVERAERAA